MDALQFALVLSAVDKLSPVVKAVEGRFAKLRDRIDKVREASERWGRDALIGGAAAAAALQQPIAAFAELEDASTRLRSSLTNSNGVASGFAELDKLAQKLGNRLPGTTSDFYEMFDTLVRKGVPAQSILAGVGEAAASLAVVLKLPYNEAAELAANLQKSLGIAEQDLLGFMDTVQRAAFLGVLPRDMEYAFARSAGALKALGLQGKEVADSLAPVFAMLVPVTNSGETAGSGFAAILRQAMDADAVGAANKELAALGVNLKFVDSAGNFAGVENLIGQLEKLKGLNQTQKLNILTALFGSGSEAQTVANTLMTEGIEGYRKIVARMEAQADLNRRVSMQLQTLTNVWDAATGTFRSMLAGFASAMAPELKALADWFGRMSEKLGTFMREYPGLAKAVGLSILVFASLAVVLGTVAVALSVVLKGVLMLGPLFTVIKAGGAALGKLSALLPLLTSGIKALGVVFAVLGRALLAHPLFALAGLALTIIANWGTLKTWFTQFFSWLGGKLKTVMPDWVLRLVGAAPKAPAARPRVAPASAAGARQTVGGSVNVRIDAEGRPRVDSVKSSNRNVPVNVDVGYAMGAP